MAHKATYELELTVEDGCLVLTNWASWKDKRLDIYKYNFTTNKKYIRYGNVEFNYIGGWLVEFPNEVLRYRYGRSKYTVELHPYEEVTYKCDGVEYGSFYMNPERITETILSVHPEYKYLMKKTKFNGIRFNIFKLLACMQMWKEHPSEVEALVSIEFYNLACNKNLYKLTPKKKKEIIGALKCFTEHNTNSIEPSLMTIQQYIKSGLQFNEWFEYMNFIHWRTKGADSIELFRYCKRKNIDSSKYHDMLSMASSQGHDIEEEYWKYPNDPHKMHEELLQVKQELERIRAEKELEKEKVYWNQLVKIAKKNKLESGVDLGNGYTLFMPSTYEQYNASAVELHQCILAAKYYKKVAKGNSLLLMIWYNGKPSSTCEIDFNKHILQHYGNELNIHSCKPSKYEQEAIKQFLATFKPKKLKFEEVSQ